MAIVGLSEFTFGFGFLFEQTRRNWEDLRIAPILPSLAQEAHDAWDARLPLVGTDFYYQFKLSDFLERRNSKFHRDGTYTSPYYRLAFHKRDNNRQHHRLWQHAQANPNTFYVTPEFSTLDDFNTAFLSQRLADHSRIIPLNECEDCDDADQHFITFLPGQVEWMQHSSPKRKSVSFRGMDTERLYRESSNKWKKIDEAFAIDTFDRTTSAVKQSIVRDEKIDKSSVDRIEPLLDSNAAPSGCGAILRRTAEILSAFLGATMVLVGEPPQ